jgi:hypothetical protein
MNMAQTQCHGCQQAFTHNGFSKHIRVTQNLRCRAAYDGSPAYLGFRPIPSASAGSLLASIPSSMPTINSEEPSGDGDSVMDPPCIPEPAGLQQTSLNRLHETVKFFLFCCQNISFP